MVALVVVMPQSITLAVVGCASSPRVTTALFCATGLHAHHGQLGAGDVRARMRSRSDTVVALVEVMPQSITLAVVGCASSPRVTTALFCATGLHAHHGQLGAGDVRARMRGSASPLNVLMLMLGAGLSS